MKSRVLHSWLIGCALCGCATQGGNSVPPGMIAMFDTECPAGWTRFEALDGRFARGSAQPGATGGLESHVHTFDLDVRTSRDGAHTHLLNGGETVEVDTGFFGHIGIYKGYLQGFEEGGQMRVSAARVRADTDERGVHDHAAAAQGETSTASSMPPHLDLVFCRKD